MPAADETYGREPKHLTLEGRHHKRSRVSENTAIFASATAVSRLAGFFRESVASAYFGGGLAASAFTFASQIPNLMSNLFAQAALSAAFVPVFTDLLQKGRREEAMRLASTLFWIVLIVLGAITGVGMLLVGVILPIFSGHNFDGSLAATLTQIMFPVVLLLGLTSVITGVLQSYDNFGIAALAPAAWNFVILGLLIGLHNSFGHGDKGAVTAYAVAWLVGTVVQLAIIAWALRRINFSFSFHLDWRDPKIAHIFKLMLPITLGLGIINLDALINSTMGALVHTPIAGAGPRSIQLAFLLYMLPQGVFSVAVSTVLFPTLSRQAARRAPAEMRHTLGNGMRQINLLLIPSAAGMMVLAHPIVQLVFQHRDFTAISTALTAKALFWFCWSLPFAGLNLLMTRTFFALQRPWLPTKLAAINMTVDIIVSVALYKPLGIAGLVIGTAAANIVMAYIQFRRLRIGFNGHLEGGKTMMITLRIVIVSALMAAIARGAWELLNALVGSSTPGLIVSVGGATVIGGAFYVWAISHMRVPEWQQIESMLRSRLGV
ncbi:MAG TPA: murein biosynthesis integral membrane protein MurJ [Solirubrobacteraceae bacterium]|nr:murein biosynthesis integral membrane protein MurJ [Solirubrobacteraceae bacterium]